MSGCKSYFFIVSVNGLKFLSSFFFLVCLICKWVIGIELYLLVFWLIFMSLWFARALLVQILEFIFRLFLFCFGHGNGVGKFITFQGKKV